MDLNSTSSDSIKADLNYPPQVKYSPEKTFFVSFEYAPNGNDGFHLINSVDPFDWPGSHNYIDVTNDHILIAGSNFRRDPNNDVLPLVNLLPSVSILKIENAGWTQDESFMDEVPIVLQNDLGLIIYPNPFTDHFDLLFAGNDVPYDSYQVFDYNGPIIQQGTLNDLQTQTIAFKHISPGIYMLSLQNNKGSITRQLIKMGSI